jgi:hypothetical protein
MPVIEEAMHQKNLRTRLIWLLLLLLALTLLIVVPINAQTGGGYDLTWSSIDGGGGTSSSGGYNLSGTAGQLDAGRSSGGGYTLVSGFWAAAGGSTIFLPVVHR